MPIPTNRTTSNTPAEHVSDHNLLHAFYNSYEGFPPSAFASAGHTHDAAAIVSGTLLAARLGLGTFGTTTGVLRSVPFVSSTLATWGALNLKDLGDYNAALSSITPANVLTVNADNSFSFQAPTGGGSGGKSIISGGGLTVGPTTSTTITLTVDPDELYENYVPGTYTGAWAKTGELQFAIIEAWGAGASGTAGAHGTGDVGGGPGGGAGGYIWMIVPASGLPAAADITIGAGGAAVAGRNTDGAGTAGQNGGATTFGTLAAGLTIAGGLAAGASSQTGAAVAGGTGGDSMFPGGAGAASSAGGGIGLAPPAVPGNAPRGGPSGGGFTNAGSVQHDGAQQGFPWQRTTNAGAKGTSGGTRNGASATVSTLGEGAAGGSGASSDGVNGNGGNGGTSERGWGGPGGGAARGTGTSGSSGRGGHGGIRIWGFH